MLLNRAATVFSTYSTGCTVTVLYDTVRTVRYILRRGRAAAEHSPHCQIPQDVHYSTSTLLTIHENPEIFASGSFILNRAV
jgi:hypothetical protein